MVTAIGIWRILCHSKNPIYLENVVEATYKEKDHLWNSQNFKRIYCLTKPFGSCSKFK